MPADTLGYLPDAAVLSALGPTADGEWRAFAPESGFRYYRMCTNYRGENVCNWMVSAEESENLCLACRFNQSIPDLSVQDIAVYGNGGRRKAAAGLRVSGLPLVSKQQDPGGICLRLPQRSGLGFSRIECSATGPPSVGTLTVAPSAASHGTTGRV